MSSASLRADEITWVASSFAAIHLRGVRFEEFLCLFFKLLSFVKVGADWAARASSVPAIAGEMNFMTTISNKANDTTSQKI